MAVTQRAKWAHTLSDAIDRDSWGQHVEACEEYTRVATAIHGELATLPRPDRVAMTKARLLLMLRKRELRLRPREADKTSPLKYLRAVIPVIEGTFNTALSFPVDLVPLRETLVSLVSEDESEVAYNVSGGVDDQSGEGNGDLLTSRTSPAPHDEEPHAAGPEGGKEHKSLVKRLANVVRHRAASAPPSHPTVTQQRAAAASAAEHSLKLSPKERIDKLIDGTNNLCVRIEKATVNKAERMHEPHVTVTLVDALGSEVEAPQDSARAVGAAGSELTFGCDVRLKTAVEAMGESTALVLELKHWKAKGNYVSTKCWAVLERADIHEGPAIVELLKKPTDLSRKKKTKLGTFLHVSLEYF